MGVRGKEAQCLLQLSSLFYKYSNWGPENLSVLPLLLKDYELADSGLSTLSLIPTESVSNGHIVERVNTVTSLGCFPLNTVTPLGEELSCFHFVILFSFQSLAFSSSVFLNLWNSQCGLLPSYGITPQPWPHINLVTSVKTLFTEWGHILRYRRA